MSTALLNLNAAITAEHAGNKILITSYSRRFIYVYKFNNLPLCLLQKSFDIREIIYGFLSE